MVKTSPGPVPRGNMGRPNELLCMCMNCLVEQSIRRSRPHHFCGRNDQICVELFDCCVLHISINTMACVRSVLSQEDEARRKVEDILPKITTKKYLYDRHIIFFSIVK